MSKHLHRDLENLERRVLAMSSMVEEMIEMSCRALREMRPELAADVLAQEDAIDQQEVLIEEECLKILALHQPVAIDLRRTATVMKINNDLERIADLAVNILERTKALTAFPEFRVPAELEEMARMATAMLRDSLDAFVQSDADAARAIALRDDAVDALHRNVISEVSQTMQSRPDMVEPGLLFISAARHVERIADHVTNICEDVVYLVVGEIARHKHESTA